MNVAESKRRLHFIDNDWDQLIIILGDLRFIDHERGLNRIRGPQDNDLFRFGERLVDDMAELAAANQFGIPPPDGESCGFEGGSKLGGVHPVLTGV